MNSFSIWFSTGFEHILDLSAADHILFMSLLALAFPAKEWKALLILVTAFTLGHSLSLALSTFGLLVPSPDLVEAGIAFSILFAALFQLFIGQKSQQKPLLYLSTLLFGLLHGMGFSFLLRSLLGTGQQLILPLLYFNIGIEAAQLLLVLFIIIISLLLNVLFKKHYHTIKTTLICCIALVALYMFVSRLYLLF